MDWRDLHVPYTIAFVKGIGVIHVLTNKGEKWYIFYVYYVSRLKHNVMSVGQLIEKGYKFLINNDVCIIFDRKPSDWFITKVWDD